MPKIFEYLGFIFFFYSNDHEPIHVHVKKGDKEVKVEMFFNNNGDLESVSIRKLNVHTQKLTHTEREKIRIFVLHYYNEIVKKWNEVKAGKPVKTIKITKEIK